MRGDIYSILGDRIREERKLAGLTMEKLAELAGISTSFLAYIETKGRKASLETIQKLAEALRISAGGGPGFSRRRRDPGKTRSTQPLGNSPSLSAIRTPRRPPASWKWPGPPPNTCAGDRKSSLEETGALPYNGELPGFDSGGCRSRAWPRRGGPYYPEFSGEIPTR